MRPSNINFERQGVHLKRLTHTVQQGLNTVQLLFGDGGCPNYDKKYLRLHLQHVTKRVWQLRSRSEVRMLGWKGGGQLWDTLYIYIVRIVCNLLLDCFLLSLLLLKTIEFVPNQYYLHSGCCNYFEEIYCRRNFFHFHTKHFTVDANVHSTL